MHALQIFFLINQHHTITIRTLPLDVICQFNPVLAPYKRFQEFRTVWTLTDNSVDRLL